MGYVTRFTPHAQRDMLKIPRQDALRILYRLAELQKAMDQGDTAAFDIKVLQGHSDRRRLRVGDYRVVYTVEDGQLIVWVLAVGDRREVYRHLP
jgi:mRNA interferase RelE/StbE